MKRISLLIAGLFVSLFFSGCAPQKMYYFGDYSETLYTFEKSQSEETFLKHKQQLDRIIAESGKRNLPVPPGIYAELGYIKQKENKSEESIKLYQTEAQLYPESKYFMDRLIQSAKATDKSGSSDLPTSKNVLSN
jgi:hypothetical protein